MPAIRQVFATGGWQIQCPTCHEFVTIDRDVFLGVAPFPLHLRWRKSIAHEMAERNAYTFRFPRLVKCVVTIERLVRAITRRFEPRCAFRDAQNWSVETWPATGISSFGPTR